MNVILDCATKRHNALSVVSEKDLSRDTSYFRYENPGLKELTIKKGKTKIVGRGISRTGYAFQQTEYKRCFPIPTPYEVWVKFDFYFPEGDYGELRFYVEDYRTDGIYIKNKNSEKVWSSEDSSTPINIINKPEYHGLHTVILHMKSDKHKGTIEYWIDKEKRYSKEGINVNDGKPMTKMYIQTADSYTWVSNIIISNDELSMQDNCKCSLDKFVQPILASNGHVGLDQFAVEATSKDGTDLTKAYNAFATSGNYINFRAGGNFVFFSKTPILVSQVIIKSSGEYANETGRIEWSDYGDDWHDCGGWEFSSNREFVIANCYITSPHRYFRIVPTSDIKGRDSNPDIDVVNIIATLPSSRSIVWIDNDVSRNISYSYCKRSGGNYGYNTGVKINDNGIHTIIIRSDGVKTQTFVDGKMCDIALPVTKAFSSDKSRYPIVLGEGPSNLFGNFDLHELRVYDRALDDEELSHLPKDDNLKTFYKAFTSNIQVYDMSGNNNNMALSSVNLVEVDPRITCNLNLSTSRVLRRGEILDGSTERLVIDGNIPLSLDCRTSRKVHVRGAADVDTKRKQAVLFKHNFAISRLVAKKSLFDFDVKRTIRNANFFNSISNVSTKRSLTSIPTDSYGYATCKEINLGDVYDIIPTVITEGTTQVEIRTAYETHNYGEWESYFPKKISCQYLQVRLKVNGYCRSARIQIKTPVQEETIAQNIEAQSTQIPFNNNYYKIPAIFPAYSNNNLVIENVTKRYCTVHIKDDTGKKVAGQVTLLVRG